MMQRSTVIHWACAAAWAAVLAAVAAPGARPAAAQFAAVAVSPATLDSGDSAGVSAATVDFHAAAGCASVGAKDCKVVYTAENQCVALAIKRNPNTYAYGVGPTREAAAANALASCKKQGAAGIECWIEEAPCGSDNIRWTSPLPLPPGGSPGTVDPALVGLWKLNVNGGIWVWQISANGTYTLHSEAPDNTPPNDGTLLTNNGHYTLHAISMTWDDQGTYVMQGTAAVVMTGKLGTGTWNRIASDPGYPAPAAGTVSGPISGSVSAPVSAPITIKR